MDTVGLVGVGHIGGLLLERLSDAGYAVVAHDADPDRQALAADRGAETVDGPAAVGERADAVLLALPGAPEVTSVAVESGLLAALGAGGLLVDCSTTGPDAAETVATAAADRGVAFVTAPVTRGGPGEGLHAMVGGSPADCEVAADLLDAVTLDRERVGTHADAQRFKLLLQLRYAGQEAIDAEVVAAARDLGLPAEQYNDLLDLDVSERLLEGDFSPAHVGMGGFAIWEKDLGYLLDATTDTRTAVPLASEVQAAYRHAGQVKGEEERNSAAIIRHWQRMNGEDK